MNNKEQSDSNNTIGKLITDAMMLHELNSDIVERELNFPKGVIKKLMSDDFYTNSVPILLFKNLIISLHIPFSKIHAAMLPTFHFIKSKETAESIKEKPSGYELWENETSIIKYANRLSELMHNRSDA